MNEANLIQKSIIGKILFVFSILILVYLLFSPLTGVLFKGDEFFTRGIVRFPFSHIITITANDVHPPLYYFILKVVMEFMEFFGFNVDLVPVFKIMSLVPAIILFIISGTYVKKGNMVG